MREAIRGALMQVKFSENQTLPQLNLGAQFGLNSTAGTSHCIRNFSGLTSGNCAATPLVPRFRDQAAVWRDLRRRAQPPVRHQFL